MIRTYLGEYQLLIASCYGSESSPRNQSFHRTADHEPRLAFPSLHGAENNVHLLFACPLGVEQSVHLTEEDRGDLTGDRACRPRPGRNRLGILSIDITSAKRYTY